MAVLMGAWTLAISGSTTYSLRIPLQSIQPGHVQTRIRTESVDKSTQRTTTIGSGYYEVVGFVDLIDDPDTVLTVIIAGMDGSDLVLSDGTTNYTCTLVEPAGERLELPRSPQAMRVFKEYGLTIRLRRKDGGKFTEILT